MQRITLHRPGSRSYYCTKGDTFPFLFHARERIIRTLGDNNIRGRGKKPNVWKTSRADCARSVRERQRAEIVDRLWEPPVDVSERNGSAAVCIRFSFCSPVTVLFRFRIFSHSLTRAIVSVEEKRKKVNKNVLCSRHKRAGKRPLKFINNATHNTQASYRYLCYTADRITTEPSRFFSCYYYNLLPSPLLRIWKFQ